ncbi:MAG: TetR/AcrR family transcriptional regulator, partial [Sciscionella sp.]
DDRERHAPMLQRLERLIKRGQATGDFDSNAPISWLLTATVAIGHAAGEEVRAGRMSRQQAATAVHQAVLRIFGVTDSPAAQ